MSYNAIRGVDILQVNSEDVIHATDVEDIARFI
jgi:hypothetical protein